MFNLKDKSVILFQGDGITDGGRVRGNDPNHIMGHGYAYNVASYLGYTYAEKQYEIYNRGIAYDGVMQMADRWEKDTLEFKPDVLSVMIGLNDVPTELEEGDGKAIEAANEYGKKLGELVDLTLSKLPECRIVLLEPVALPLQRIWQYKPLEGEENGFKPHYSINPLACYTSVAVANNMKYFRQQVKRIAEEKNLIFVPLQEDFEKATERVDGCYWLWDGSHPTYSGHDIISEKWLKTVQEKIKF